MWDDSRLFGFDMRHRTPPQIMPTALCGYEKIFHNRKCKQFSQIYRWEVELLAGMFGIDASKYYPHFELSSNAWRYGMKTDKFGFIEIDVFRENILLLPKEEFYQLLQLKLQKAGIVFSIVGDEHYININKKENELLFKKLREQLPS